MIFSPPMGSPETRFFSPDKQAVVTYLPSTRCILLVSDKMSRVGSCVEQYNYMLGLPAD